MTISYDEALPFDSLEWTYDGENGTSRRLRRRAIAPRSGHAIADRGGRAYEPRGGWSMLPRQNLMEES